MATKKKAAKKATQKTTMVLAVEIHAALAHASTETGRTQSELIEDALRAFLPTISRHAKLELEASKGNGRGRR